MKDDRDISVSKKMKELAALRPDKEKEPEKYAEWQAKMLSDCTVIHMDPESEQWKAYIAGLQRRLELKRGSERPGLIEVGYRVYN